VFRTAEYNSDSWSVLSTIPVDALSRQNLAGNDRAMTAIYGSPAGLGHTDERARWVRRRTSPLTSGGRRSIRDQAFGMSFRISEIESAFYDGGLCGDDNPQLQVKGAEKWMR
jgi:hypothetical protein